MLGLEPGLLIYPQIYPRRLGLYQLPALWFGA
jgi:hypothetical protein